MKKAEEGNAYTVPIRVTGPHSTAYKVHTHLVVGYVTLLKGRDTVVKRSVKNKRFKLLLCMSAVKSSNI